MCPEILLITGDSNFHLDNPLDSDARKFLDLLETFGLSHHVMVTTHTCGHTLDLIISRSSNDIIFSSPRTTVPLSDHLIVEGELNIPSPNLSVAEVHYRKLKQIDVNAFTEDIISSELCGTALSCVDDLARSYEVILSNLFEVHAPLKSRVMILRPKVPWLNDYLKRLKSTCRTLEGKMLKTQLQCDKDAFRTVRNKFSAIRNASRSAYHSELIESCTENSKRLFSVVNTLCKERQENPLPPHEHPNQLANEFGEFFCKKIETIKADIDNIVVDSPHVEFRFPETKRDSFSPLSEVDVRNIIIGSSNATCSLDPIPAWLQLLH